MAAPAEKKEEVDQQPAAGTLGLYGGGLGYGAAAYGGYVMNCLNNKIFILN